MEQNEEIKTDVVTQDVAPLEKQNKKEKTKTVFAIIFLVLGTLLGLFSFICALSFLIPVFYYIFLFCVVIFTLGLIFVENPQFGDKFKGDSILIEKIAPILTILYPFVTGFSLLMFVLSIILFSCSKIKRKKVGIIISSVFLALYIFVSIIINVFKILLMMN